MKRIIIILALICACICIRAQWQWQNPLPQGNTLWDVYFIDQDMGWALGEKGVIIRTIDGGANWELLANDSEQDLSDIFFIDEFTGWVAGHSQELSDGIVLKTSDGGVTWNTCLQVQKSLCSIYFNDADHGWVGSRGNHFNPAVIYMTEDGGVNWVTCCDSIKSTVTSFSFINSDTGFAATGYFPQYGGQWDDAYIYKTIDGGYSWEINYENGNAGLSSICFVSSQIGYAAGTYKFLKTLDCGNTWLEVNSIYGEVTSLCFTDSLCGWATYYQEDYSQVLCHTVDGGLIWDYSSSLSGIGSVYFIDNAHGWAVGHSGLIYQTENEGDEWNNQLYGERARINSLNFVDSQHGWAVGGHWWGSWGGGYINGMIMSTVDGGNNWESLFNDTAQVSFNSYDTIFPLVFNDVFFKDTQEGWIVGGNYLYSTFPSGLIMHSIDAGLNWEIQIYDTTCSFNSIHLATENQYYVIGSGGSIYKTFDSGNQWVRQNTGLTKDLYSIFFVGPTHGWAGGEGGTIIHTKNGGISWEIQSSGIGHTIKGIYFENGLKGWLFAERGDVIYTEDGGETWELQISDNFQLNDVCVDEYQNFRAVGGDGKLYYSNAESDEWISLDSKTNNNIYTIHFIDSEHGWVAGRGGTILYTSNGGAVSIQESNDNSPFIELKTYPNPFTTSTTLSYTLDKPSNVTIRIFNSQGQQVQEITQKQPNGEQKVQWNTGGLPSGMYYFRLQAGDMVGGGKMVKMD